MKKLIFLLFIITVIFSFVSCDLPGNDAESSADTTKTDVLVRWWKDIKLSPNRKDLPTIESLRLIQPEDPINEVVKKYGNPQRFARKEMPLSPTSGDTSMAECFYYDSIEGDTLCIVAKKSIREAYGRVKYTFELKYLYK